MATEEIKKTAGSLIPTAQQDQDVTVGNGDIAHLIGSVGSLIDSTIESVQGMISSVSNATGQLIDGVSSTINSESVQGMISSVSNATGQLIDGVTSTINSDQIQNSFQGLGKLWNGLIETLNNTVSSNQVQNLFDNVSSGLGQLMNNVFAAPGMPTGRENRPKKDVTEIRYTPKEIIMAVKAPAPTLASDQAVQP